MSIYFRRSMKAFSALALILASIMLMEPAQARDWRLRKLASLCSDFGYYCLTSASPMGPLAIGPEGDRFGITGEGGIHFGGSAFRLYRDAGEDKWHFHTIYNFCALANCADGSFPVGIVAATDGNLYGVAADGGSAGKGTFFRLSPNKSGKNWILTTLYNFCSRNSNCSDGGGPTGGLTYKGAAAALPYDFSTPLYGVTTEVGHGIGAAYALQQLHAGQWKEKVLYRFCKSAFGCDDGDIRSALLLDSAGNLEGTAYSGGDSGGGLAFKLSPSADGRRWTQTILYNFCSQTGCTDGAYPNGGLVEDASGNLFGVTELGGNLSQCNSQGCGVLYEITPDGAESTLYRFCSLENCIDGSNPSGTLFLDAFGNLYGTASTGGKYRNDTYGGGAVFRFAALSLTTLRSFCAKPKCPEGEDPSNGVIMDAAGDLFGTTVFGGSANMGTVFELDPR